MSPTDHAKVLRLRTFGGLSLEGERGPLGGAAAQRRRLAVLAILGAAGELGMTRDKLVGILWPEVDEARARSSLSQALYALKRDAGAEVVIGHDRLTLNPDVVWCDLTEFERALARGDAAGAAALYAGPFLDGVFLDDAPAFEPWLDATRARLARQASGALEALATAAEGRGEHTAAAERWSALATLEPLESRAALGLVRALARAGDRAAAIREGQRYARRVEEDVGEAPHDAVTELVAELRSQVERGRAVAPLPLVGDDMIGRDAELDAACALLARDDVVLVTLTGPGGTGKTRLAVQMARRLQPRFERVSFIDLAPVRESAAVIPAVATALGVQPQSGRDALDSLAAACAGSRMLLVLDNFEQVVAAAPQLTRFAAGAPGVKLLVTSRMRLCVRAEHEFFVAPLGVPDEHAGVAALRANDAVRLFERRARAANPAIVFDDEAVRAAARVCARLDGLPLAIELAAARCRLMSPRTVAARVDAGFDVVSGGGRDVPERHRAIRHAIAWSVALLAPDERRLWGRMSVFAGGCTLAAVEAVCADDAADVIDGAAALVDASLLLREPASEGGEPRLRMLETVRELAGEELARDPEADVVRRRFRDWCRALALACAPALTGERQHAALAALASEHANLSAALEAAIDTNDGRMAVDLGASLWRYWLVRGHLAEGERWLTRILAMPTAAGPALEAGRAEVATGLAHIAQNTGAVDEAARHFGEVLALRRRRGDREGEARALADLGWVAWRRCDFAETRRLSAECLAIAGEVGATRIAALALTNLGAAALFEGDHAEARDAFARSAELRARVADRRGVAYANTWRSWAECRGGDAAEACSLLDDAEATLRELGDQRLTYFARDIRAELHLRRGDAEGAAEVLAIDSMSGVRRFGDRWSVAHGLAVASWASRMLGRVDQAAALAAESLELRRAEGDRHGEADSLAHLAAARRAMGDEPAAIDLLRQSRTIRLAIGDRAGVAECDAELSRATTPA